MEQEMLTSQILLDRGPPLASPFVEVHFRHTAPLQPINRNRQLLAQPFLLDLTERVHVRLEGENQRFGLGQPVQRLALASHECLESEKSASQPHIPI
jgi:hypothetical protein